MAENQITQVNRFDHCAIISLNMGVTNPISPIMLSSLNSILDQLKEDNRIHSIVLTSTSAKFFSIGFEIPMLYDFDKEKMLEFYRMFNSVCIKLFTFPKPTIAAIKGHAVAGGCILTLCCDYRHIAHGNTLMGLNEIVLGVPVPFLADCILRDLIGIRFSREIIDTGKFLLPEKLIKIGMVDKIYKINEVEKKSAEYIGQIGDMPASAFEYNKSNRVEVILERYYMNRSRREDYFVNRWYDDDVRMRLKKAIQKF
jgi:enoyl-CoA hydratase/carnithine racemase